MISELKLLRGSPIEIKVLYDEIPKLFCKVYPLTLNEIVKMEDDELEYYKYLNILLLDAKSLDASSLSDEEINKITHYSVILYYAYHDVKVRLLIEYAFSLFLKEQCKYLEPNEYFPDGCFFIGDFSELRIITDDIFEEIRRILVKQNYIQDSEEEKYNPANDKAKELIEKMKQVKEKLKKQNKEEGLKLSDITSIVSTYSRDLNILSVWRLTVYQLYENYLRLLVWDRFHTEYQHLPYMDENGQKSIQKAHWNSKINK